MFEFECCELNSTLPKICLSECFLIIVYFGKHLYQATVHLYDLLVQHQQQKCINDISLHLREFHISTITIVQRPVQLTPLGTFFLLRPECFDDVTDDMSTHRTEAAASALPLLQCAFVAHAHVATGVQNAVNSFFETNSALGKGLVSMDITRAWAIGLNHRTWSNCCRRGYIGIVGLRIEPWHRLRGAPYQPNFRRMSVNVPESPEG